MSGRAYDVESATKIVINQTGRTQTFWCLLIVCTRDQVIAIGQKSARIDRNKHSTSTYDRAQPVQLYVVGFYRKAFLV